VLSNRHDYEQPTDVPINALATLYTDVAAIKSHLKRPETWYYITLKFYDLV
jgi:hypothetical protein